MPSFKKQLERQSSGEAARPDLVGHDRTVQELHKVNVTLTRLLQATTRNPNIPIPAGPVYPAEVLEKEQDEADIDDAHADVEAANRRHRDKEVNADVTT